MKIKSILGVFLFCLLLSGCSLNSKNEVATSMTKSEIFEKDEYCRKTYSDSFMKNYEKKLIGIKKDESETIKLVDMFYSPTQNECIGVYDYLYFNFENIKVEGKSVDINMFQRRIAKALSADIILNSFELTSGGNFDNFQDQAEYNKVISELKGEQ